ncbi:flagellar basal-body MS-ring/collar protein FliF [Fervidibacillus halotolerans]|uniref:Flagellar M-ring protein n=1 Tax=Fervidibacillus halotolerans TaxID=2980027 RepID=A0A9E8RZ68_9BACI|nr:flagellar basal-body MS-ring/collar protein FliF [Fervidibacillus halotolerans]WAA13606.1 flagellar basal-body MS-ring/collar protein FliF [Fervidibacillus halotolerans]
MKEQLQNIVRKIKAYWNEKNKQQKMWFVGSLAIVFVLIAFIVYFSTRTTMVPLYSDLTPAETGRIKETLDEKGIQSEITENGTTIKVPKEKVESLLVELAAEGIPQSGNIDYSFFSSNAGIGMTDNEFNVMKLDAMQTELANLIKTIEGIQDANVMINLPEQGIFVKDQGQEASASIVITTKPGYNFTDKQINGLYTLVSKSVPNLPTDNIVIMNQNFEYFDDKNGDNFENGDTIATQYKIKREIERDIQRQVQSFLGMLMGQNNVIVSVSADIDFTQENREENLVEPVDEENNEGITISAQKLTETYSGTNVEPGGIPAAEDNNDALGGSYIEGTDGSGEYERTEETVNKEVNRIRKQIVESPYKIRDLGIQVVVEPPEGENATYTNIEEDIQKILSTIIRTTIYKDDDTAELTDEQLNNKIAVSFQPLLGKMDTVGGVSEKTGVPLWAYIIGAMVILGLIFLILFLLRRRRSDILEEDLQAASHEEAIEIPDLDEENETESTVRKKRIERMAKERPEEFAKLIRTWLSQD